MRALELPKQASRPGRGGAALLGAALLSWAAAAEAQGPLDALLARVGEREAARSAGACTFVEESLVEQLDSDGKVEGSVTRRHRTTMKNARIVERTLLSKVVAGKPSSMMVKDHETSSEPQYSALHPSQQVLYVFSLAGPADGTAVRIRFAPKKKGRKRLKGVATVEATSGRVVRIEAAPSDPPALLQEFELTLVQEETACGFQTTRISMKGRGGFLFLSTRFRADTRLTDHQPGTP